MSSLSLLSASGTHGMLASLENSPELRNLVQQSVAPSTFRLYSRAWLRFADWLQSENVHLDDLNDAAFARWISDLFDAGLAPASIGCYAAGVKFILRLAGHPSPAGPLSERAMAGAIRAGKDRGRGQSAGVQWKAAQRLANTLCNKQNVHAPSASLRDAAAIALASDCLLRVSEIAAINAGDLSFDGDGNGGLLHIRSSKTDQAGKGAVLYFGAGAFHALSEWLRRLGDAVGTGSGSFGLPPGQPVFTRVYRGDAIKADRVSSRRLQEILKAAMVNFLPDDGRRRSSHSFRIGTAQSLAAKGASLVELQNAGRWADPSMPAHYARGESAKRGAVARLLHRRTL